MSQWGTLVLIITKDFAKRLKDYAVRWTSNLTLMPGVTSYEDFTDAQRAHIDIVSNALYRHKTLQLRYTTYDMQGDKDTMRQTKYPGIMVLSDDEEHPYLYGSVIDIFHINVRNSGPCTLLTDGAEATLPMVWVRWFQCDRSQGPPGFHSLRHPSVSFCNSDEPDAFGLIHPDEIVRAVHLIPRFQLGRTDEYLSVPSRGRPATEKSDWKHYSINM
jgi:hypothetical protein